MPALFGNEEVQGNVVGSGGDGFEELGAPADADTLGLGGGGEEAVVVSPAPAEAGVILVSEGEAGGEDDADVFRLQHWAICFGDEHVERTFLKIILPADEARLKFILLDGHEGGPHASGLQPGKQWQKIRLSEESAKQGYNSGLWQPAFVPHQRGEKALRADEVFCWCDLL